MSDIFISYASSTVERARLIEKLLLVLGYGVWRDDELPAHRPYGEVIEERLRTAKAVIVVWSESAVKSQWVRAEADVARQAGKLVQLRIDGAALPLPFNQIQCADLTDWRGDTAAPGWRKVIASIADLAGGLNPTAGKASIPVAAHTPDPLEAKPSIAVMPFSNLSGDADQEYFADGMVVEIVTALSRIKSIVVIASGSSLAFKNKAIGIQDFARQLGVRYVLEGSVRRSAAQVRIAAALIDAVSGQQIWGERYDRSLDQLFALQDETARAIVIAMAPHLEHSEIERARGPRPQKDSAYALAQRAWAQAREGLSRSNRGARDAAVALARQALAIDPRCSAAHNAIVDALSWHLYFDTATPSALHDALDAAAQALAIDSNDALAYRGRGWLMLVSGKLAEATADLRRSLELNPNDAFTLARLGACESFGGDPAGGLRQCLQALRLSPRDPARFHLLDNLIWAQFSAKAYDDAIDTARQSLREANFAGTRLCLVLCLVGAGDLARAGSELRELKRLQPDMVAARLGGRWLAGDAEVRQREIEFLHAAHSQANL